MRIEVLSDHVGEQYDRIVKEIDGNALLLAKHRRRLERAEADLRAARRRKGLLKRLFRIRSAEERRAQQSAEGARQAIAEAGARHRLLQQRRLQTAGGLKGEERFRSRLARLPDEWTYLAGYKNRAGEIDAILIGPKSVWAVEVKSHRAHLHVDGDKWWYEKYDQYGNSVETRRAVDGGGRNWGRQASDPARRLESWLARNGHRVRIRTAVVLTNHRASLGDIRNQQVDLITCDPFEVVYSKRFDGRALSEAERDAIASLIRRDHQHHRKRRAKPRPTGRKTRGKPR